MTSRIMCTLIRTVLMPQFGPPIANVAIILDDDTNSEIHA